MKFLTLFAASAAANLIPRAEVDMMKDAITNIQTEVDTFANDIAGYQGGDDQTLRDDAHDIILAINAADADAKSMPGPLNDIDAASLSVPIQALGTSVGIAVQRLISKKTAFGCYGGEVYQSLQNQFAQSTAFKNDLTARVGPLVKPLAATLAAPIMNNLQRGLDAFQDKAGATCETATPPPTDNPSKTTINDPPVNTPQPVTTPTPTPTPVTTTPPTSNPVNNPPVDNSPTENPTNGIRPVKNPDPVQNPAPVQKPAPVQDPVPVQNPAPVQDPAPVQNPAPVQSPAPVDSPAPIQNPAPVSNPPATQPTPAPAQPVVPAPVVPAPIHTSLAPSASSVPVANSTGIYPPIPTVATGGASSSAAGFGVAAMVAIAVLVL